MVDGKIVEKPRFLFSKVSSSKVFPRWRTEVVTVSVSTPRPARHKTRPRSPETAGAKLRHKSRPTQRVAVGVAAPNGRPKEGSGWSNQDMCTVAAAPCRYRARSIKLSLHVKLRRAVDKVVTDVTVQAVGAGTIVTDSQVPCRASCATTSNGDGCPSWVWSCRVPREKKRGEAAAVEIEISKYLDIKRSQAGRSLARGRKREKQSRRREGAGGGYADGCRATGVGHSGTQSSSPRALSR